MKQGQVITFAGGMYDDAWNSDPYEALKDFTMREALAEFKKAWVPAWKRTEKTRKEMELQFARMREAQKAGNYPAHANLDYESPEHPLNKPHYGDFMDWLEEAGYMRAMPHIQIGVNSSNREPLVDEGCLDL